MTNKVAIVDIDGCLCEYPNPKFFTFVFEQTGTMFNNLRELKISLGDRYEEIKNLYRSSGVKRELSVFPDAVSGLNRFKSLGFSIYIATSRPNSAVVMRDTYDWLISKGVPFDELIFTGDKSIFHFSTIDREVIVVDDEARYLLNYLDQSNVTVFKFSSFDAIDLTASNCSNVKDWHELINIIDSNYAPGR